MKIQTSKLLESAVALAAPHLPPMARGAIALLSDPQQRPSPQLAAELRALLHNVGRGVWPVDPPSAELTALASKIDVVVKRG